MGPARTPEDHVSSTWGRAWARDHAVPQGPCVLFFFGKTTKRHLDGHQGIKIIYTFGNIFADLWQCDDRPASPSAYRSPSREHASRPRSAPRARAFIVLDRGRPINDKVSTKCSIVITTVSFLRLGKALQFLWSQT